MRRNNASKRIVVVRHEHVVAIGAFNSGAAVITAPDLRYVLGQSGTRTERCGWDRASAGPSASLVRTSRTEQTRAAAKLK